MCHLLSYIHALHSQAVVGIDAVEAFVHLVFSAERLDDTQSAECLLNLRHGVAPQILCLDGVLLELASYESHEPSENGHEEEGEYRELPRYEQQCREVGDDEDWILEQHVE